MARYRLIHIFLLAALCVCAPVLASADETATFTTSAIPNVLIILDNSNSMDQSFTGNAVGPWRTDSRLVEAKRALINSVVNPYIDQLRIGLMTYAQSGVVARHLHYVDYFRSYNPATYCPNPPAECVDFCTTGSLSSKSACQSSCVGQNASFNADRIDVDEVFGLYAYGSADRTRLCKIAYPKTQRLTNPTNTANYMYYKVPAAFYSGSNAGSAFCYSGAYNPSESGSDSYRCYASKTGTDDGSYAGANPGQYGGGYFNSTFTATDDDIALGFVNDWGRRMGWSYSGRVWFSNGSPGGGNLDIEIATNNTSTNAQKNALLAKLATKEGDENGYMSCASSGNGCAHVVAAGLTPTAGTLQTAYTYFKDGLGGGKASPIQYWCQPNFIIYVTDGLPSVSENGTIGSADSLKPAVLAKLNQLRNVVKRFGSDDRNFDIKTYVLGVGMTPEAKQMLNDFAIAGGTSVDGTAYYADNPGQLASAIGVILQDIIDRTYSFTTASIKANRLQNENYLFVASFDPIGNKAFWPGHLQRYQIDPGTGVIASGYDWDAAERLISAGGAGRDIFTYVGGGKQQFSVANMNITQAHLGASSAADRATIINTIRGGMAAGILGDSFHSNPVNVSAPNRYYQDNRDANGAYNTFRMDHQRNTDDQKIILLGANDGQLHAFSAATGDEKWSFIPPNMLPKLKLTLPPNTQHSYLVDGPLTVSDAWLGSGDGTSKASSDWKTVAVVSIGKGVDTQGACGTNCNTCPTPGYCYKYNVCLMNASTCKDSQDKCVTPTYLWSASASCDTDFSAVYNPLTGHVHYCGYHALNVTETLTPSYLWHVGGSIGVPASSGPFMGEPWSKMQIGRVLIGGQEKWVGFFGGGFNPNNCAGGGGDCDTRGKGFFVVDLSNGQVIWKYTFTDNALMTHSLVSSPAIIDIDNDGLIDTAYVGDMQGNIWRFKFCKSGASCTTSNWNGSLLYDALGGGEGQRPIYGQITAARDLSGNLWIYWVTGDRSDPTKTSTNEKVFGLREDLPDQQLTFRAGGGGNFENVTSLSNTCSSTTRGWYMNFTGEEKSFSDVSVFGGVIYFTTYTPPTTCSNPCESAGKSWFYAISMRDCSGALNGARKYDMGGGMASSPIISVSSSGHGDIVANIGPTPIRLPFDPAGRQGSSTLFWRDRRIQ